MSKYLELTKDVFGEKHAEKQADQMPYVGYSFAEDKVIYSVNPNYLCLEPLEENNQLALFKLGEFSNIKYSFDKKNWNNFPVDSDNPFIINYITVDKPVYLRGYNLNGVVNMDELSGCKLTGSGKYNVSGDITTLLNIAGDVRDLTPYGNHGVFSHLFAEYSGVPCVDIVDASKLILPATVLVDDCYSFIFSDCTSLTTAPELPATTLARGCYDYMFSNCTSLTTAPELPATTLAERCYGSMFYNCSSLVAAPELPATTLADSCYSNMFQNCTSLTTAPELPATELAVSCYNYMFEDCSSLVTVPELPATILADYCYDNMFNGCTSLVTAPELPATTLARECYENMFTGCSSLTIAPVLPATTLAEGCYSHMFFDCTNLDYIKCLATDIPAYSCTSSWVDRVASKGTFVKHQNMTGWSDGSSGIPYEWEVIDALV